MRIGLLPSARRLAGAASALVLCALTLAAPPAVAAPTVWVVPSLERVSPDAALGGAAEIHLDAARGEYESFQIIVRASPAALSNVNLLAPDLTGPGGTIARGQLTLYREHYVYVGVSSPDWGGRNRPLPAGWYPDALIPFVDPATGQDLVGARFDAVPFDLPLSRNQLLWVDVLVPRIAVPGDYQGTFTVTSDQGNADVTLSLTVWDFELPLQPALKSSFGTEESFRSKAEALLRHRLMPRHLAPQDERAFVDADGLNCIGAGFWSGADVSSCAMDPAPAPDAFLSAAALHQPDLFLYAYTADEIGACANLYPAMREWALNMHASRIQNLVTMAPAPELYDDGSGTNRSAVDIWVMLPKMYEAAKSRVAYVLSKGDAAWSYNALVQDDYSPKWQIDFSPLDYRLQAGFISQSLELTGLLYWRADVWTADPWTDPGVVVDGYPFPGEGLLLYPGADVGLPGGVVPSLRLKYLRDGVDDYDYVELLKNAGQNAGALTVARSVGPDWTDWTRDPNAVEAARRQLGEALHSLAADSHSLAVVASATPATVTAGGSVALTATASDNQGHSLLTWSWSDGGAGGSFSPSASVQNPTYLAPDSTGGADLLVTLTVAATCPVATSRDSAVVTVTPPAPPTFYDLPPDYWALSYIRACAAAGIVGGYDDGTYRPTVPVTRDQMAVFVSRALAGGDAAVPSGPAQPTFPDVPTGFWAYRYVEYAAANSIVGGYPGGNYRPALVVDRGQMAVFIARAVVVPTGETGLDGYTPPADPTFRDAKPDYWAYKYIEYIASRGIVTGYDNGTYRPLVACTRDQMAVFIARAFDLLTTSTAQASWQR